MSGHHVTSKCGRPRRPLIGNLDRYCRNAQMPKFHILFLIALGLLLLAGISIAPSLGRGPVLAADGTELRRPDGSVVSKPDAEGYIRSHRFGFGAAALWAHDRILREPRERGTEASSVEEEYIHAHIACPLVLHPGSGADAAAFRPTAWLIPAQGNRPGFTPPFSHRRPTACFIGLTRLVSVWMRDESRFQRWESSFGRHTQGDCPGLV